MILAFDFSPQVREVTSEGAGIKQADLARIAGVSESTVSRWRDSRSGLNPDVNELRRMANCSRLPEWFREACANVVMRIPTIEERSRLDVDGDGRLTVRDAELLDASKQITAAQRRLHFARSFMDGTFTEEELQQQEQLCSQERALSLDATRVLQVVAAASRTRPVSARARW